MTYVRCSAGGGNSTKISFTDDRDSGWLWVTDTKFAIAAQEVPQLAEPPMAAEEFKPKGAIAFFVALLLLYAVMWLSVYFEVLRRG